MSRILRLEPASEQKNYLSRAGKAWASDCRV